MDPHPGVQKVRFCNYLLHLSEVQRLKKGPRFGSILGPVLPKKKKEKRGFRKSPKDQSQKTLEMGPKPGGGILCVGVFFHLWTLLGPTLLLERSWTSIFHYFGVTVPAFLCSSTLPGTAFFPSPPQSGGGKKLQY